MPIQSEGKRTLREIVSGFTGVDLRSDPSDIGNGEVAKGLNVDFYECPGVAVSRRGIADKFSSLEAPQRLLIKALNSIVSFGATKLYFNGIETATVFDAGADIAATEFKSSVSTSPEIYILNGSNPLRYLTSVDTWGIDSPIAAPLVSQVPSGSLTGDYSIRYTYVRKIDAAVVHESNPSPASPTLSTSGTDIFVEMVASSNSDVTHNRIYRTAASGTVHLFDQEVAASTTSATSSQADTALGSAVDLDNDRPTSATLLHVLRDRIWTNDSNQSNRLRYSKRFLPEAFPAANFVDIISSNEVITAISSINGVLIAFTETTKFRIVEQGGGISAVGGDLPFIGAAVGIGTGTSFFPFELPSSRGCRAPNAVISMGQGIIYPTKEGVFLTNGGPAEERLLSEKIQTIFIGVKAGDIPPIDFSSESNMVAGFHRGRYYLSYTSTESIGGENDYTAILNTENGSWYFWQEGFTSFLFDDVDNMFLAGDADGNVKLLEDGDSVGDGASQTAVSVSLTTPDKEGGDPLARKLFMYARVDAEVPTGATLTAAFYTDNTLRKTFSIAGDRTRELLRLPSGSRGFTWRVEFTFSGASRLRIHGVETQWKGMTSS